MLTNLIIPNKRAAGIEDLRPNWFAIERAVNSIVNGVPLGTLKYVPVIANQTNIGTGFVAATGLSATVTVAAGRRLSVRTRLEMQPNASSDIALIQIMEGATVLTGGSVAAPTAGDGYWVDAETIQTPSSGTHTYSVQVRFGSSLSGALLASATGPAFIIVEDIGT